MLKIVFPLYFIFSLMKFVCNFDKFTYIILTTQYTINNQNDYLLFFYNYISQGLKEEPEAFTS